MEAMIRTIEQRHMKTIYATLDKLLDVERRHGGYEVYEENLLPAERFTENIEYEYKVRVFLGQIRRDSAGGNHKDSLETGRARGVSGGGDQPVQRYELQRRLLFLHEEACRGRVREADEGAVGELAGMILPPKMDGDSQRRRHPLECL